MIDIYEDVFALVYEAAHRVAPTAVIQDAYIPATASFPCVTVQEIDNTTSAKVIGSRAKENAARCSYQIEVYSNKQDGSRTECRTIMAAVSDALIARNFERILLNDVPNYMDASVYRLTARFQTIADANSKTYRR